MRVSIYMRVYTLVYIYISTYTYQDVVGVKVADDECAQGW